MAAASSNRFMPVFWFVLFVFLIPFGVAFLLFDVNQFQGGVILALLGLFAWLVSQGAGWRPVEKETAVIREDTMGTISAHPKGSYLYLPVVHAVKALLPIYPLTFEFPVEQIDTRTPGLAKITRITVRATCRITDPAQFYRKSLAYLDMIKGLEENRKLKRTDLLLWKQVIEALVKVLVDDSLRDVVWKWSDLRATNPDLLTTLPFESLKNSDDDPYGLSLNRSNLASQVLVEVVARASRENLGITVRPLVLEAVEIDPELIKRKTANRDREREKAVHDAAIVAAAITARGEAEAGVRSVTLAKLLDVLINQYDIPHTDPLIAQVVRAALYSDGQMIWNAPFEKQANGDAKGK